MTNLRSILLPVIVLAAAAATATAQPAPRAKYTRPTDVKITVKLSDRVKPSAPKTDLPKAAPDITADQVLSIEGKVGDIRGEQVQILDDLIQDCIDTKCDVDEAADLYFRKAELHAQQQRFYRLKTQEFAIKSDNAKKSADKASFKKQSDQMAKSAQTALIEAVKVYKALADNDAFRNYSNMPKALFFYGYTLQSGKYMKEARDVYDKLLKNYPQSPYVPEAHLAFADYHFEAGQLADAESRYQRVLQFPKSPVYWYAKYKLGWVRLNLGRHQDALEMFHDVAMGTRADANRKELHRAAVNDIVRAYAEVGNVHRAHAYFKKVEAGRAFAMYELLADLVRDQGKTEKAIYVYRDLIKLAPRSASVCLWQHHVAEAMITTGSNPDKLDEIDRLARLYAALSGIASFPKAELAECKDLASGMAGDMARAWHAEWAKTRDLATYALSDRAYRIWMSTFRGEAELAETEYFHAELVWSRADYEVKDRRLATQLWEDAAAAFVGVVDTGGMDRKTLDEAARAVVLASVNSATMDPRTDPAASPPPAPALAPPDAVARPQPIPQRDRKVLAAFELYVKSVRDRTNPELIEMMFYQAALLRRYEHHAEAIPILDDIVAHHRDHAVGEDAVDALLDSYNQLRRHAELVALGKQVAADAKFLADKPELKARLVAIEVKSMRIEAQRLEAEGRKTGDPAKLIACGTAYAELYNRDTEAAGADELLYDAAVCFEDGKSVGLAIDMYERLEAMGAVAREDIRAHAVARMGAAYARIAYYPMAAKYLELYYAKYAGVKGDNELADPKDAVSDAVIYRKGIGDDTQAIKDTMLLVGNRDASAAEKAEAFFNLYAIYDKLGDTDKLVEHLREYLGKHAAAGGGERLVQAHARIGLALWNDSCPVKLVDGACIKVTRVRAIDARRTRRRSRVAQVQCGPGAKITVVERDARKVKEATAAFGRAIAEYERRSAALGGDGNTARYWYAVAKLTSIEPRYEAYLARAFPANLDFDPKHAAQAKQSLARFDRWLADKDAAGKALALAYRAVIDVRDAPNAIAAAARIGGVAQNASESLSTAEIPAFLRPYPDAVEIYCDKLADKTEALDALTVDAYTACLDQSTRLGFFSDASKLCERELGQLQPGRFPSTLERRAAPTRTSAIVDVEPPRLRLE